MECEKIIASFIELHNKDGFVTLPSASLLHPSVPMSFVMSAGLIQVENDLEEIKRKIGNKFAFNQPCFRYFDMEHVGKDSTHLSLFNMSAAFYVGSSDRANILPRLWYFLINILKLNKDNLWVTYLDDKQYGRDEKSYSCWRSLGVTKDRIIGLNKDHNFWQQNQVGQIAIDGKKCGPHTEIFYEYSNSSSYCCSNTEKCIASCNCGRFIEISNSLFIENYISEDHHLINAETVFSECVIGIERLAMILQKKRNVHQVARFSDWRKRLENHFSDKRLDICDKSVNIIIDNLSSFMILTRAKAPPPGRGGRAGIMRNLARSALTQVILHDLDVYQVFQILLERGEQDTLGLLINEYERYRITLQKGKRKLEKLILSGNNSLCDIREGLRKYDGLPYSLTEKYYYEIKTNQLARIIT